MKIIRLFTLFCLLLPAWAQAGELLMVSGKVLDGEGKPVAGAQISSRWIGSEQVELGPTEEVASSDENGQFQMKVRSWNGPVTLLAYDKERKRGALGLVRPGHTELSLQLEPLIKVSGAFLCPEFGRAPQDISIVVTATAGPQIVNLTCGNEPFSLALPAGRYDFLAYGNDVQSIRRKLELEPGMETLEMKVLEMKATILARHRGQALPAWTVTEARGLPNTTTLADFKGKWVVIEFFTHWCGPCVNTSLPALVEFYDQRRKERDKFEILAFHVDGAKDLADYDQKMARTVRRTWRGKDLPFPLLLDGSGKTLKALGLSSFPTVILINPEGQLVGKVSVYRLAEAMGLAPEPTEQKVARAMDTGVVSGVDKYTTLNKSTEHFGRMAGVGVALDEDAREALGAAADEPLLVEMNGRLTLRSWFAHLLPVHGLKLEPAETSLRVRRLKPGEEKAAQTPLQEQGNRALAEALNEKVSYEFIDKPLRDLRDFVQAQAGPCLLDASAWKAGKIDPLATINGSGKDQPLHQVLARLLEPLKLQVVIRDEAIVICPQQVTAQEGVRQE